MVEPQLKTVYWTVTTECNQRCKHCWLDAGAKYGTELTTDQWLQIFDRIIDMGLKRVKITGGEPLLHWPKIRDVLRFLADHRIWLRIESNATLISGRYGEEILEFLQRDRIVPTSISLDSHRAEEHDYFRGMKGAFEKTLRVLSMLRDRDIPFSIVTVLHSENYIHIEEIIDFVTSIGARSHQINPIMFQGRAKDNEQYNLAPEFYVEYLPLLIRKIRKEKKNVAFNVPYMFSPLSIEFLSCTVGKEICGLLPNGDIAVCGAGIKRKELTLGNALEDDIEDVWVNSPAFLTLREDAFSLKGVCGNCIFAKYCLGYCRAFAYSIYGQLDAPYPICQHLYNQEVFPEKYLIDPGRDCSFQE
jgi:radical SAM protein with 4Fe4S-binding SPASM domain